MAAAPMRTATLSPFDSPSGRQSPFRRQNSVSPATTGRTSTLTTSPTKTPSNLSPTKAGGLSPEKTSPFVRRPSQISHDPPTERPSSPFTRPTSGLGNPISPTRQPRVVHFEEQPALQLPGSNNETASPADTPSSRPLSPVRQPSNTADTSVPPAFHIPSQATLRSATQRTTPASPTTPTSPRPALAPFYNTSQLRAMPTKLTAFAAGAGNGSNSLGGGSGGAYNHIPQSLLHSMRESFEVLDQNNRGTVDAGSVAEMLSQLGLEAQPSALKDFFPPHTPAHLNLARYLDMLAGPLTQLSPPEELRAAFEAFDVDDSGQIDVAVLRDALLETQPDDVSSSRMTSRDVDAILAEFTARRAFGAKGVSASKNKGDVFRYRDFITSVSGGSAVGNAGPAAVEGEA